MNCSLGVHKAIENGHGLCLIEEVSFRKLFDCTTSWNKDAIEISFLLPYNGCMMLLFAPMGYQCNPLDTV